MNALLHLTWVRLSEQRAKLLYLVAILSVVVLAWMVLSAFASPSLLSAAGNTIKAELELANARAQNDPFPVHYMPRIKQMPGVASIDWFTMTAFFCADGSGKTVSVTGLDGDVEHQLRERGINEADLAAWNNAGNGILVGPQIARQCNLIPGTTISPANLFGTGEIPFQVIAILPERGGFSDNAVNGHYAHVNRFMDGPLGTGFRDKVIRARVRVHDPARLSQLAHVIEQEFQSSAPPLEAVVTGETNSLLGRFGQLQALLLLVMGAMVLCALLVFVVITAHLVAQRRASMAVLQTLGFEAQMQFFSLLLELTGVVLIGTMLGVFGGRIVLTVLTPWAASTLLSDTLRPVDGAMLILLPAMLALLIVTLVWPGVQIAKLKPMDYLRI